MKVLVTGGAGFIGSNFIHHMLEKYPDIEIVNFDVLTYAGNLDNHSHIKDHPRYTFIRGDITNPADVQKAMKGVDTVVHFAAESHVDRSILEPAGFVKTNVLGTQVLLDAALKEGVDRFHHVSTDEVFGALEMNEDKFNENTPYHPHSPYSASKAASDHLVRAYGDTFGLKYTITNCSNNYGPFHFPEKLIPLAITNLLEGKKVPVYGSGKQVRDWLYVKDHCEAIDLVLQKGKPGETYCIGGMTDDLSNLDLVKMILKIMGKSEDNIQFVTDRPGHDLRYAVDWSKINRELGWEPKYNFEEGLRETIQWYIDRENWWKKIKSGGYKDYYEQNYGSK